MRIAPALLVVPLLLLAACQSSPPDVMPAQWFLGTSTVEPAGAAVFGPSGETALSWEIERGEGVWIWNESRPNGWNSRTVWRERNGEFVAAIDSGAWEGFVKVVAVQMGDDLFQPESWTSQLLLTDGSGVINGTGQITGDQPIGTEFEASIAAANRVFVEQKWIRPDGTVAATLSQRFTGANEEEYRRAVARHKGVAHP